MDVERRLIRQCLGRKLLNRFISADTYRAVVQPDRKTDGGTKTRLRRINQNLRPAARHSRLRDALEQG